MTGTWSMTDGDGDSGYDTLNRLTAAEATSGPYAGMQASWNYDSFGNRTFENFSGDLASGSAPPIPASTWAQYNANNQVQSSSSGSAPAYDAAGDITQDDQNQYLYDAEGRVCASLNRMDGQMTGYLYDADGNRVAKGPISAFSCDASSNGFGATGSDSLYILGSGGEQLTEMTWSGGQAQFGYTNVRAAGQLIARYSPNGSQVALSFDLRDWLGTLRARTDYAGNILEKCQSLPYGNGESCVTQPYLFTGKERDAESGNDYFIARYYSSDAGRFLSPDWSAKAEPVPYAKLDNPQSLNLYSYVYNNPVTGVDLDGHQSQVPGDANMESLQAWCHDVWGSDTYSTCVESWEIMEEPWIALQSQLNQKKDGNEDTGSDPAAQQQSGGHQPAPQPAPTGEDGKPTPPPVLVPGCPSCKWVWSPDKQNPRGGRWVPDNYPKTPGGIPGASWDPGGHWDVDPGNGPRGRYLPDGTPITPGQAHPPRTPMDSARDWLNDQWEGFKQYLRDHPYGPNSNPGGGLPPVYMPPVWAIP